MDGVYQAVKSFLKSFVNLFVAVIELFTALINGIASLIGKLRPRISDRYAELKSGGSKNNEAAGWKIKWREESALDFNNGEEMLVEKIRIQLNEKITCRDQYLFFYARVKEQNAVIYGIVLSVLALVLAGGIVVSGAGSNDVRIFVLIIMLLACAAACIVMIRYQKQDVYRRISRLILEKEFCDRFCDGAEAPKAEEDNGCQSSPDALMVKETSAEESALEEKSI
ncbi:hypothetical protein AALA79_00185 [Lachnospiraceae bacterium 64-25]|nr:hypothetical protein IMSAGC005_03776 [Lachnospiraceae bacterium]